MIRRAGVATANRPPGSSRNTVPEWTLDTSSLLRELIAHNHLEIGRADGKAAVLLATAGPLLSLLLVRRPAVAPWAQLLWWSAVLTAAAAVGALLLVLIPRRESALRQGMRVLAYFEDVVRAQNRARLSTALEDSISLAVSVGVRLRVG